MEIRTARFNSVVLMALVSVLLLFILSLRWEIELAVSVVALSVAIYNLRATNTAISERLIEPGNWRLQVQPDRLGPGLTEEDFDKVRHILRNHEAHGTSFPEDKVRMFYRQHKFFYWLRVIPPAVVALACFVLAVRFGDLEIKLPDSLPSTLTQQEGDGSTTLPEIAPALPGSPDEDPTERIDPQFSLPDTITTPVWLPVLAGALLLLIAWVRGLSWKYNFRLITDWSVPLVRMPPVWMWWWPEHPRRLKYQDMTEIDNRASLLGRVIGGLHGKGRSWGTVLLTSGGRRTQVRGQPDYLRFMGEVDSAHGAYQLKVGRNA